MAAFGIHLGGYLHVIAAAAGLSLLLHPVPMLYLAVKFAGAAYVIWLGIALFRASAEPDAIMPRIRQVSGRDAFFESVAVEVLNPKTAIFFLAFLPQLIDASAALPISMQFVLLGIIVNLMFSATDVICVLLAGAVLGRLQRLSRAPRLVRRSGGAMIVALGIDLALRKS